MRAPLLASGLRSILPFALLLAGCGASMGARYEAGNHALSDGDGALYFLMISPRLQRALNECIPPGTPGASPVLVLVADVAASGRMQDVDVEPDSPGTECFVQRLTERPLPPPPVAAGAASFPIGLRIETK
jgi:hypothetical protein